ncbi:unnamed protein product [Rotaria sp. Silwood2]|nr:unnamed protein product [Rotaria sp. Silwood2]
MMEIDPILWMTFSFKIFTITLPSFTSNAFAEREHMNSCTVHRDHGLSQTQFDQIIKTKGGLLSFNNFLSTSRDRDVSLAFVQSHQNDFDLFGVLFEININSPTSTIPFANVHDISYFKEEEEEILFFTYFIFRIGSMKQIDENNYL